MITNIEELAEKTLPKLLKSLIYQNEDNTYVLFEEYSIARNKTDVVVKRFRDDKIYHFFRLRHATAWAILDKYNKFYEANRILELDIKLESVQIDKAIHRKLKKSKNIDEHAIHSVKLQTDLQREKQFRDELDKYIVLANRCQQRGFKNEPTRS